MHTIESALAVDFARRGSAVIPVILLAMIAIPTSNLSCHLMIAISNMAAQAAHLSQWIV
jgi:hypothetical protein